MYAQFPFTNTRHIFLNIYDTHIASNNFGKQQLSETGNKNKDVIVCGGTAF